MGQKPKTSKNQVELSYWHRSIRLDFDIRQHQNDQLVETNLMVPLAKLYLILLSFRFLTHFLLRGLTWAVLRAWT